MEKLLKALWEKQASSPFIIRRINTDDNRGNKEHQVDLPCQKINDYRSTYDDKFDVIIYVKLMNGFYIIPFHKVSDWFVPANILEHDESDKRVWRLYFSKPHFFRCTKVKPEDMASYFYSGERMEEWANTHYPDITQTTSRFTWVPIYRQIAEKVVEYRNRQDELIDVLKNLQEMGFKPVSLEDHIGKNETVPLTAIDPFTFLASFNVSLQKDEKARRIIEEIQKAFGLEIRGPDDFYGTSNVPFSQTWFFNDKMNGRKEGDIPLLWDFAEAVVMKQSDRLTELFPKCLEVSWIRSPKLTSGLSWLDPENYIACNEKTISYCKNKFGLDFSAETWQGYMDFTRQLRVKTSDPFYKIAHEAYNTNGKTGTKTGSAPDHESSPTVEEYHSAIVTLLGKGTITGNIKICLAALHEEPSTITKLSNLVGYKNNKGARLPLGLFGKQMCDIFDGNKTPYPQKGIRVFVSGKRDTLQNNEVVHTLRPNFRVALEQFPLEDWKKAAPDPPEESSLIEKYLEIDEILEHKKQVIFFGPPGTGKTYLADKYVEYKTGNRESELIFRCTFHPEYGYEHFIEGFKPEVLNGQMTFVRQDGIFKDLCDKARADGDSKYYLIIDEINRGDIPRIFGELITLIEADKRGISKVRLPHCKKDFSVPGNVYIIATMNTADRSIALVDIALRRRFGFLEMESDHTVLGNQLIDGIHLGQWLLKLNEKLAEELKNVRNDAKDVKIGHSYLMANGKSIQTWKQLKRIVKHEILPLLKEYCYDANETFVKLKDYVDKSLIAKQNTNISVSNDTQGGSAGNVSPVEDDMEEGA